MFRIRNKTFVPKYSDQAAVSEGSHNFMENGSHVRKQAIVVVEVSIRWTSIFSSMAVALRRSQRFPLQAVTRIESQSGTTSLQLVALCD
jgi:hypothetical protein